MIKFGSVMFFKAFVVQLKLKVLFYLWLSCYPEQHTFFPRPLTIVGVGVKSRKSHVYVFKWTLHWKTKLGMIHLSNFTNKCQPGYFFVLRVVVHSSWLASYQKWSLTPLTTVFNLYHQDPFHLWWKPEYPICMIKSGSVMLFKTFVVQLKKSFLLFVIGLFSWATYKFFMNP